MQFCKNLSIIKRWLLPGPVSTGATIAALLLQKETLCFLASPWFPTCKCSLCDNWYYICAQWRSGRLTQVPFRIITQATKSHLQMNQRGRKSASECGPVDQRVCSERFSSVSVGCDESGTAQVLSKASSSCLRLHSRALIGLCAEERLRSADQVTWINKSGWSHTKSFLGRLGNRIMILKGEPWLGFKSKRDAACLCWNKLFWLCCCVTGSYTVFLHSLVTENNHNNDNYMLVGPRMTSSLLWVNRALCWLLT